MNASLEFLLTALQWRYATKQFDPARKIPIDVWAVLEQALILTPSSFGLQPWKFLIVENPAVRKQLLSVSWGQTQVTEASHFVVFTVRENLQEQDVTAWVARMSEVQGTPVEDLAPLKKIILGFVSPQTPEGLRSWNTRQSYIALGQLMTAAALLGVDTCPMEGLEPTAYDEILGLRGSGYVTAVACALGYRSATDKYAALLKVRYDTAQVIQRV